MASDSTAAADAKRRPDPERTRQAILAAARDEFAAHGLSGARVDAIAARTGAAKRMIYYYFGSKEGLYLAVLEAAYADIRRVEQGLGLDRLPPLEAIRRLIESTFDYEEAHPEFIRLVSIENIHNGKHIAASQTIQAVNSPVIATLAQVLDRGKREGVFRLDAEPTDVHMLISAVCFFRVSNRHSFGVLFDCDLLDPAVRARHRAMLVDAVLHLLTAVDGRSKAEAA
ncbi:MAG: TetR/AcrR family transcriptional regulator [Janthinobacterium lividum]